MKIISSNKINTIYSDEFVVLDQLKPAIYDVCFNKFSGYSLKEREFKFQDMENFYGSRVNKVNKIVKSYENFNRNLGIIMSGEKGMGKTMFARRVCNEMINKGYPVILISRVTPNLVGFINSIEQEAVIFFDEFEKIFKNSCSDDEPSGGASDGAQDQLLPLFDGTSVGKKMFIVTINNLNRVSNYFLNRPGRFHYHFRFSSLSREEVKEYLEHEIKSEYKNQIDFILNFTDATSLNYDCLRAIVFEVNSGENIVDIMDDLNIMDTECQNCKVYLRFNDGTAKYIRTTTTDTNCYFDKTYEKDDVAYIGNVAIGDGRYIIEYYDKDMKLDYNTHNMCINVNQLSIIDRKTDKEVNGAELGINCIEFVRINSTIGSYKDLLHTVAYIK